MRFHVTVTTAATALALALAAVPAGAQVDRMARFHAEVEGLQTTKWSSVVPGYADCNGTRTVEGAGTEVVRFQTRRTTKVLVRQLGSQLQISYDTWDPYDLVVAGGLSVDARVTRGGGYTASTSGGWCSGGTSEPQGPYDCGQRRSKGFASMRWTSLRRFTLTMSPIDHARFVTCPVEPAPPVAGAAWLPIEGRLSPKLLFGDRAKIVVEEGDTYRLADAFTDAVSTVSFKLTLTRAG